jgi:hypothetical protein
MPISALFGSSDPVLRTRVYGWLDVLSPQDLILRESAACAKNSSIVPIFKRATLISCPERGWAFSQGASLKLMATAFRPEQR